MAALLSLRQALALIGCALAVAAAVGLHQHRSYTTTFGTECHGIFTPGCTGPETVTIRHHRSWADPVAALLLVLAASGLVIVYRS